MIVRNFDKKVLMQLNACMLLKSGKDSCKCFFFLNHDTQNSKYHTVWHTIYKVTNCFISMLSACCISSLDYDLMWISDGLWYSIFVYQYWIVQSVLNSVLWNKISYQPFRALASFCLFLLISFVDIPSLRNDKI